MTRQLDLVREERTARRHDALIRALEFELEGVVASAGGHLTGFSIKIEEYSILLTLRAVFNDTPMYTHTGADSIASVLCKSVSEVRNDRLRWKRDKYVK